jgi:hypothetical protein
MSFPKRRSHVFQAFGESVDEDPGPVISLGSIIDKYGSTYYFGTDLPSRASHACLTLSFERDKHGKP